MMQTSRSGTFSPASQGAINSVTLTSSDQRDDAVAEIGALLGNGAAFGSKKLVGNENNPDRYAAVKLEGDMYDLNQWGARNLQRIFTRALQEHRSAMELLQELNRINWEYSRGVDAAQVIKTGSPTERCYVRTGLEIVRMDRIAQLAERWRAQWRDSEEGDACSEWQGSSTTTDPAQYARLAADCRARGNQPLRQTVEITPLPQSGLASGQFGVRRAPLEVQLAQRTFRAILSAPPKANLEDSWGDVAEQLVHVSTACCWHHNASVREIADRTRLNAAKLQELQCVAVKGGPISRIKALYHNRQVTKARHSIMLQSARDLAELRRSVSTS
jgi:hypothetical protein